MPSQWSDTRFARREPSEIGAIISLSRIGSWLGSYPSWRIGALALCTGLALFSTPGRAQHATSAPSAPQILPDPTYDVTVMPDGQAVTANPGAASYTFTLQNVGNTTGNYALVASCTGSASACTPSVSSTSIAKGATKTIVVNYTAAAIGGPGTVTLQATSTADASYWDTGYITVTVPGVLYVSATPTNNDNQNAALCAVSCFTALHAQSTVPYVSMDTPRSVTILYNGDRVAVRPFVLVDVAAPVAGRTMLEYRLQATVNSTVVTFLNGDQTIRFSPPSPQTDTVRLGGQFDASYLLTNMYPMTITVTAVYTTGSPDQQTINTNLMVINERKSLVARGWTISGLQRVYAQTDGSLLVTEGDGSGVYFRKDCSSSCVYVSPEGDYSAFSDNGATPRIYTRAYADSSKVRFNSTGLMDSTADRFGVTRRFAYDGAGRLTFIEDPIVEDANNGTGICDPYMSPAPWPYCGHASISLTYNSYGLATIKEPDRIGAPNIGRITTVAVVDSMLTAITDPDSVSTNFTYDGSRRLWKVTDRRGNTSDLAYNGISWKLDSVSMPSIQVDQGNGTTTSKRPTTRLRSWQTMGVPTNGTASTLAPALLRRNATARVTDPEGDSTSITVDRWGQPLRVTDALGNITAITRSGIFTTSIQRPTGAVDTYRYSGQFLIMAHPAGADSTNYRFGAYAQLDSVWGPKQPFQTFKYGPLGRLDTAKTKYTQAASDFYTSVFTHDLLGRLLTVRDPVGHTTAYHYDGPSGNLDSTTESNGAYTRTVFDHHGRDSLSFQLGKTSPTTTTYDKLNRVTQINDGVNTNPYRFEYDALFPTKSRDPLGQVFRRDYNEVGWVTGVFDPTDTLTRRVAYRFNADGKVTSSTNRQQQIVDYRYDRVHRLVSRRGATFADSFAFTPNGLRRVAINSFETDSVFSSAVGWTDSVVTRIAGQRFRQYYRADASQRLDSADITMQNGPIVFAGRRYLYNGDTSQLSTLRINSTSWLTLRRNSEMLLGNIDYQMTSGGWKTRNLLYTTAHQVYGDYYQNWNGSYYVTDGNLLSIDLKYGYDSLGRVAEVTESLLELRQKIRSYGYTQLGQIYGRTTFKPNATCVTPPSQNAFGFNCRSLFNTASSWTTTHYVYDAAGNLTSEDEYDGPSVVHPSRVANYTYTTGNRVSQQTTPYRPQVASNRSFTEDLDGNVTRMTSGATDTYYQWNAQGQLVGDSVVGNGRTIKYDYNALGQLARRRTNGLVDRYFLWDGDDLLAELDSTGRSRITEYVYLSTDAPAAVITGPTTITGVNYVAQDQFGNVVRTFRGANSSLQVDLTADYDDWGTPITSGPLAATNRLLWKGMMWEGDSTQLYYARNRWYSPKIGRFMSEDPIGTDGGMNVYAFAENDPVNGSDSYGLGPQFGGGSPGSGLNVPFALLKLLRNVFSNAGSKYPRVGQPRGSEGRRGTGPKLVCGPILTQPGLRNSTDRIWRQHTKDPAGREFGEELRITPSGNIYGIPGTVYTKQTSDTAMWHLSKSPNVWGTDHIHPRGGLTGLFGDWQISLDDAHNPNGHNRNKVIVTDDSLFLIPELPNIVDYGATEACRRND